MVYVTNNLRLLHFSYFFLPLSLSLFKCFYDNTVHSHGAFAGYFDMSSNSTNAIMSSDVYCVILGQVVNKL